MNTTTVVHIRDGFDEYIGRPMPAWGLPGSMWGNPYKIGDKIDGHPLSRDEAIELYERRMRQKLAGPNRDWWRLELEKLRGKRLGCWCSPKPCHGDVLVKLMGEFDFIAMENRRLELAAIMTRNPGAVIIDVTAPGQLPWVKFSPFYPTATSRSRIRRVGTPVVWKASGKASRSSAALASILPGSASLR